MLEIVCMVTPAVGVMVRWIMRVYLMYGYDSCKSNGVVDREGVYKRVCVLWDG